MEIKTANRLKGIGEYYFSQKLREIDALNKAGKDIVNLGIGSPDMPPHPEVIRVLQDESSKVNTHAYQSYKGSPVLRKAISEWYKKWYAVDLDPEQEILPLIGSKEGIMHICMTYLNKGDKVFVPDPGYPSYASAVKLAGGQCIPYRLREKNDYKPVLSKLMKEKKVKLLFLNYPHMPTGSMAVPEFFEDLILYAKNENVLLVHDNPYSFILNPQPVSILSLPGAMDVCVELNSLSKSHNMAGWRVGMLCGAKERVEEVLRFKSNMDSGMFLPVQLAAAKALSLGMEWFDELNRNYHERRELVYALLDHLKCSYSKDQAGLFVWAKVPDEQRDGYALSDELLNRVHVFITPGGIFGAAGKKYIRVSLCAKPERLAEALKRISH
jgi:aspartate/methionine/tyrosine aminotransferase